MTPGKDSQSESGGTNEKCPSPVRPNTEGDSPQSATQPTGEDAKPTELQKPTTGASPAMESAKWACAADWDKDELEDSADFEDWTKPGENEMEELEKIKAKLQSKMVTLSLEGAM